MLNVLDKIKVPDFLSGECFLSFCGGVANQEASEITIQSNRPIFATMHGELVCLSKRNIMDYEVRGIAKTLYGANIDSEVGRKGEVDFAYHCRDTGHHFRVNITKCYDGQSGGIQISIRVIPRKPKPLPEYALEERLMQSLSDPEGLILVTGATGSGKTTLIASLIDHLLEWKELKILTYESPIEFIHGEGRNTQSIISQTQIPEDLRDFSEAVRNALRRTPDIIMVGEVRDKATLDAVIEAALTGHTVMTTLHSKGVVDAIRRALVMFPAEQQQAKMYDLIQTLKTVVWQKLVPAVNGKLVALQEYIIFDEVLREKLIDKSLSSIDTILKDSFVTHGSTFADSALRAYRQNLISKGTYNSLCLNLPKESRRMAESSWLFHTSPTPQDSVVEIKR